MKQIIFLSLLIAFIAPGVNAISLNNFSSFPIGFNSDGGVLSSTIADVDPSSSGQEIVFLGMKIAGMGGSRDTKLAVFYSVW
jgi:hypothetical protein